MASTEEMIGDADAFPAVNASRELNLGVPEQFPVDPVSSDVATSKELKEEAEAEAEARAKAKGDASEKCDLGGTLTSVLMVSGVVVVAVGVAFFVTKKLKEA
ncbi:uncharacterized protein [Elaeis guineensis]|uniref:Uncharacterized protein LOC105061426 isoform X1 n=1 Tax=Elaeis guineensis var. tenera TaxID=51953 RepID=A0A6I9SHC7_ELAGV|nr:uncharacterized protein LOC105061426 isoform X1 [Elaeis guineensis]